MQPGQEGSILEGRERMYERVKVIWVMSVLPYEVVIALKKKSGKTTVTDALQIAIYHYLRCAEK